MKMTDGKFHTDVPVIFYLDFDGVLNGIDFLRSNQEKIMGRGMMYQLTHSLDPKCIERLNRITEVVEPQSMVRIVISSSWGGYPELNSYEYSDYTHNKIVNKGIVKVLNNLGVNGSVVDFTLKKMSIRTRDLEITHDLAHRMENGNFVDGVGNSDYTDCHFLILDDLYLEIGNNLQAQHHLRTKESTGIVEEDVARGIEMLTNSPRYHSYKK